MHTLSWRALTALTLFTGLSLSAHAGVLRQDITPAARLGSNLPAGPRVVAPVIVVPMPAQLVPVEIVAMPMPMPMPAQLVPVEIVAMPMPMPMPMPAQLVPVEIVATPMPAQLVPVESVAMPMPAPVPMPALMPASLPMEMPLALDAPTAVPEPGTMATLAAGLMLMCVVARRRRTAR